HVEAIIVPGSKQVEQQAIAEGIDKILAEAGFELREPGCSACLAMNEDKIPAGAYCTLHTTGVPLPFENVDTDQIIPARFLKATTREGFGENLFRDWRYNTDGSPKADFVLNEPRYSGQILVAGRESARRRSRALRPPL
nr:hypothetical protein [Tanacetum cinerariifolium]